MYNTSARLSSSKKARTYIYIAKENVSHLTSRSGKSSFFFSFYFREIFKLVRGRTYYYKLFKAVIFLCLYQSGAKIRRRLAFANKEKKNPPTVNHNPEAKL